MSFRADSTMVKESSEEPCKVRSTLEALIHARTCMSRDACMRCWWLSQAQL